VFVPELGEMVHVEGEFDPDSGVATWTFKTLDRQTLEPTSDPLAGFLPPNHNKPEGEGHVVFTIYPRDTLVSGDAIGNSANIVFDTNNPIVTDQHIVTLDLESPVSAVESLPPTSPTSFVVSWSGTDADSGMQSYDVYASDDGGAFTIWQDNTTDTSAAFTGQAGHTYRFYSIATDIVGHEERPPVALDAETTVSANPWQNPRTNLDVNDDGDVIPFDVLYLINELNNPFYSHPQTRKLPASRPLEAYFLDVNNDGYATPLDALAIVNFLNSPGYSPQPAPVKLASPASTLPGIDKANTNRPAEELLVPASSGEGKVPISIGAEPCDEELVDLALLHWLNDRD
jgi:hypothetical protein